MVTIEGQARTVGSAARDQGQHGSRASRLAEASQQLEIVLEGIDLDAEPEFGAAVVGAIDAVAVARSRTRGTGDSDTARPTSGAVGGERP